MNWKFNQFSPEDILSFQPAMKIGLLATVNPEGEPHISLISSLMAADQDHVIWGQFTEGISKQHILDNPLTGFLIMSLAKEVWMGQTNWTHSRKEGVDYDRYNNLPMFRYNAYFGVHTVHYMDLIGHSGRIPLPMNNVIFSAVKTSWARFFSRKINFPPVLNNWTQRFLAKIDGLKYIAAIDQDGVPFVFPAIQAQAASSTQILFSTSVFPEHCHQFKPGSRIALYGMSLDMETVLVRGEFQGFSRRGGIHTGSLKVDWVYNSMPPVPGQIYPPAELETITQF